MSPTDGRDRKRYWIDLIRDGERWTDPVGLGLDEQKLSSAAISLLAEFALENASLAGPWSTEVRAEDGQVVLTATLTVNYPK